MARFRVVHRTVYEYGTPMADGFTTAHLRPRATSWQTVEDAAIAVEPAPDERIDAVDVFGNFVTRFAVHRPHSSLVIESTVVVDIGLQPVPSESASWESVAAIAAAATGELALEVGPYLAHTAATPRLDPLRELTDPEFTAGRPVVDAVSGLCRRIFHTFQFDPSFSDVSTPLDAVLDAGSVSGCGSFTFGHREEQLLKCRRTRSQLNNRCASLNEGCGKLSYRCDVAGVKANSSVGRIVSDFDLVGSGDDGASDFIVGCL
jgi:transglutaminase-like putative cysteine protease